MAEENANEELLNDSDISPANVDEVTEQQEEQTEPEMLEEPTPEPEVTEPESPTNEESPGEDVENDEPILNDNTNYRRKKIMKYGLKEVADVIFFDTRTGRPVIVFDT